MKEDIKVLLGYVKDFFAKKRLIYSTLLIFLILAILNSFLSQKEYSSSTSFIAQVSSSSGVGSGLKNIADLIGLNLGSKKTQKDIPIYLYPKLMKSLSYNRRLKDSEIKLRDVEGIITLGDYYSKYEKNGTGATIKKYTIGLPSLVISSLKRQGEERKTLLIDSLYYISKKEAQIFSKIADDVVFGIDELDGSISITATMLDPEIAAQVCKNATQILQEEIINYRLEKARERYDFVNKEYIVKKEEYEKTQLALAIHSDKNRFNVTERSLLKRRRLENESGLAYAIYSELENKRIIEQISLNENTPVFTVIQPPTVPLEAINPSLMSSIVKYLSIGFIIAIVIYFFSFIRLQFKDLWRSS